MPAAMPNFKDKINYNYNYNYKGDREIDDHLSLIPDSHKPGLYYGRAWPREKLASMFIG